MNLDAQRPSLAVRLLLGLSLAKLGLHFLSNGPLAWGYMTDELYFLDSLPSRYIRAIGIDPPQERERGGELPMHLGLYLHADAALAALERAYTGLPPEDRDGLTLITRSFGETDAVNVLGAKRGLRRSVGVHNQYWLWGPGEWDGERVLLTHDDETQLRLWFESCERRSEITCPYCMEIFDAQALFLCRHARLPLDEIWRQMKIYR